MLHCCWAAFSARVVDGFRDPMDTWFPLMKTTTVVFIEGQRMFIYWCSQYAEGLPKTVGKQEG